MPALSVFAVLALLLSACTPQPLRVRDGQSAGGSYSPEKGERAVKTARDMIGRPYKFKGDTPEGFDCSGLVRYSYLTAGMDLPHGTAALRKVSHPVPVRELRKGDLVFFDQEGKKFSHVGIFAGGNAFVHAPSSGKAVRVDSLADAYWKKHFLEARRL